MTRRQRITVTNDDELANALERMRPFFPGKPAAALVHDLAIKGVVAIEEEELVARPRAGAFRSR
jgi:hypothetical protein